MGKYIFFIILFSYSTYLYAQLPGYFVDKRDGKKYPTIQIGNQIWLNENLVTTTFQNGDSILEVKSAKEWQDALINKKPAFCFYDFDSTHVRENGKIYNWYAITDQRGLSPEGWYIPSSKDVELFESVVNSLANRNWSFLERWNRLGFEVQSGGSCTPKGSFNNIDSHANWWTIDEDQTNSWSKFGIGWYSGNDYSSEIGKQYGFSVRCIKTEDDLYYSGSMNDFIYSQMTIHERILFLDCFRDLGCDLESMVWASEKTKKKLNKDSKYYYSIVTQASTEKNDEIESYNFRGKHHLKTQEYLFTLERKNGNSKIELKYIN